MYYVYTYTDPSNGEVFYVGKGQGNRLRSHLTKSHSASLKIFVGALLDEGISPVINKVFIDPDESLILELEEFLIAEIGRIKDGGTLFNELKSGGSNTSVILPQHVIELLGTLPDEEVGDLTGYNWSTLRDKRRSLDIKSFQENTKGTEEYSKRFLKEDQIITLFDTNGNSYTGGRRCLCRNLNIDNVQLGSVLKGSRNHIKGYFLKPSKDITPYTRMEFFNGSEAFIGTYHEFSKVKGFLSRSVRNACTGHRVKFLDWVCTPIRENKKYHYE